MTTESDQDPLLLWDVLDLRLTAFHTVADSVSPQIESWWSELVGQVPETHVARPKEGIDEVTGTIAINETPADFTLRSQPDRIDWTVQPKPAPLAASAYLGPLPPALSAFSNLVNVWVNTLTLPLTRLALGATLLIPVQSHQEGYTVLSQFVPFPLDPDSFDFLYRINRPVLSASLSNGTRINRLTAWSVLRSEYTRFVLAPGISKPEPAPSPLEPFFACRLQMDINTEPDPPIPLPPDKYADVLAEFCEIATSLAQHGDQHESIA